MPFIRADKKNLTTQTFFIENIASRIVNITKIIIYHITNILYTVPKTVFHIFSIIDLMRGVSASVKNNTFLIINCMFPLPFRYAASMSIVSLSDPDLKQYLYYLDWPISSKFIPVYLPIYSFLHASVSVSKIGLKKGPMSSPQVPSSLITPVSS